ncbi:MAG: MFS transporter [Coriobacteriales bacterium]|jgi:MFS family permease|nr:MFS transporter [Coriobacteriales bacterium]
MVEIVSKTQRKVNASMLTKPNANMQAYMQTNTQPATQTSTQTSSQPATQTSTQPVAQPISQPFTAYATQSNMQPATQPTTQTSTQTSMQPATQPIAHTNIARTSDIAKTSNFAWLVAVGCFIMNATGLAGVMESGGVFLGEVAKDVGDVTMFITCYFVTTIIAMPIVGQVLQKYNTRVVLTVAFLFTAGAFGASGFYTEVWMWYINGIIFGFFGSFVFVVPVPIMILNWFKKRTGLVMGIVMCGSGIGGIVLSRVYAVLISSLGWRFAYLIAGGILLVLTLPFTMFVFSMHPKTIGKKAYGAGEDITPKVVDGIPENEAVPGVSGVSKTGPGVPLKRALTSAPFVMMFLICGLVAFYGTVLTILAKFGQSINLPLDLAANLISVALAGNMISKIALGWLNDKIGINKTILIQFVMIFAGLLMIALLQDSYALLLVGAFLFGAQATLYSIATPLLVRRYFGEKDFTRIFTWARVGTGVLGAIGSTIVFVVFSTFGSYTPVFFIGIGVIVVIFICFVVAELTRKHLSWED